MAHITTHADIITSPDIAAESDTSTDVDISTNSDITTETGISKVADINLDWHHPKLSEFDEAVEDLENHYPTIVRNLDRIFCPHNTEYVRAAGNNLYPWCPSAFTKANVASGLKHLDRQLDVLDKTRTALHADIPRERFWNGRFKPTTGRLVTGRYWDRILEFWTVCKRVRDLLEELEEIMGDLIEDVWVEQARRHD